MLLALAVFVVVTGSIVGAYVAFTKLPGWLAAERLERRLQGAVQARGEGASRFWSSRSQRGGRGSPGPRHRRGFLARRP